jgi:hypothetical protein
VPRSYANGAKPYAIKVSVVSISVDCIYVSILAVRTDHECLSIDGTAILKLAHN